jgi:hypothetical protein
VELREPESESLRRAITVGVTLGAAIAAVFLYLRFAEWRGTLSCEAAYTTAYTATDTALIDVQESGATTGRGDSVSNVSCGDFRSGDKLR